MTPIRITQIIETFIFIATIVLFVWLCAPDRNPLGVIAGRAKRVLTRKRPRIYFICAMSILISNAVLTHYDDSATEHVIEPRGDDYTAVIHGIEGDAVAELQALRWQPFTWFMGYAYVVLFPCLVIILMLLLDFFRLKTMLLILLLGYALNYLFVLPFYFFFPVRECHDFTPQVALLLDDLHPAIMPLFRPMSGLDNCFPSFHTSLAGTLALVAVRSGNRRIGILTSLSSAAIIFSTLYLGVPWFLDIFAGIITGVVAHVIAELIGRAIARRVNLAAEEATRP